MTSYSTQEMETPCAEFALMLSKMPNNGYPTEAPAKVDINEVRRKQAEAPISEPWDDVEETDITIPVRDGTEIAARIYRPHNATSTVSEEKGPLLVAFHGGGFCFGGLAGEEESCRIWARKFRGVAVNVVYRHAPEFKFPTAPYDTFDSLKWCAKEYNNLKADPNQGFIVAGTSSGASLAVVASHLYRDEQLTPPLTGVYQSMSAMVAPDAVPEKYKAQYTSWTSLENTPVTHRSGMEQLWAHYQPDAKSPLYSPLLWPSGHASIPPTYLQVCGMDPLRDGSLIYERILREENGIKTKLDVFPGQLHGFFVLFPKMKAVKDWREKSTAGLEWLLQQK